MHNLVPSVRQTYIITHHADEIRNIDTQMYTSS